MDPMEILQLDVHSRPCHRLTVPTTADLLSLPVACPSPACVPHPPHPQNGYLESSWTPSFWSLTLPEWPNPVNLLNVFLTRYLLPSLLLKLKTPRLYLDR